MTHSKTFGLFYPLTLRISYMFLLLLFITASAHANPIGPGGFPHHVTVNRTPEAYSLTALFIEVLIVTFMIRKCRLQKTRFILTWFAVNILTCYVLLVGVSMFFNSVFLGECAVFITEAVALYWVSRWSFLQKENSVPVTVKRAIAASIVGNLSSLFISIVLVTDFYKELFFQ